MPGGAGRQAQILGTGIADGYFGGISAGWSAPTTVLCGAGPR